MEMKWVIILFIIAYGFLFFIFFDTTKKCNALKKENDRLKELLMKFQTSGAMKKQKLQEYQSIINKIKTRYQDSKDGKKK